MISCRCCQARVDSDALCIRCLRLVSAVVLRESQKVVAGFWDVSEQFEQSRAAMCALFAGSPFAPDAAIGCALGLIRTAKVDDGLCLVALCVAHTPDACWGCIGPGRVLTDPVALRCSALSDLRRQFSAA